VLIADGWAGQASSRELMREAVETAGSGVLCRRRRCAMHVGPLPGDHQLAVETISYEQLAVDSFRYEPNEYAMVWWMRRRRFAPRSQAGAGAAAVSPGQTAQEAGVAERHAGE